MGIKYRHEWKHVLNTADLLILRQRLRAVMESDPHAVDGRCQIRSLYFDNEEDKALREKSMGSICGRNSEFVCITVMPQGSIWKRRASATAWEPSCWWQAFCLQRNIGDKY